MESSTHFEKLINTARLTAINKSNCVTSKHAAILIKNGKYICGANNTESLHAEINCMKQALIKGS